MLALLAACREPPVTDRGDDDGRDHTSAPPAPVCPAFGTGEVRGALDASAPAELSGLVVVDGVAWAVDDGEDALFALSPSGARLATVALAGADGVDREDLAWLDGRLLIADVGDNRAAREDVALLAVELPPVADADGWPVAARTTLTWPGGPRDAETVLADPVTGDVLVVEKAFDGVSTVIRVGSPLPVAVEGEVVAELAFGAGALEGPTLATGGAVSPAGDAVVIRTYLDAWVWPRVPGEPWADTFGRDPCPIDLRTEPQGEAIAFADDGLWTISEGEGAQVWFYPRTD